METPAKNKTHKSHKPNKYKFEKLIFEMLQTRLFISMIWLYIMLEN